MDTIKVSCYTKQQTVKTKKFTMKLLLRVCCLLATISIVNLVVLAGKTIHNKNSIKPKPTSHDPIAAGPEKKRSFFMKSAVSYIII